MAPAIEGMVPAIESSEGNNKMNKGYQYPSWKKKLRGLVVDNEELCRIVEKGIMGLCGVETQAVETGEAAVELIASGATFDIIVIDRFLPSMTGPETARKMREMGVESKIIGLFALYFEGDEEEFVAAGVDDFKEKPLSPNWLVPMLRELDN
ncbi:two-component response regulator 24-like [Corylus avellana]|uniref:two-component response regulator 24-like n=1 Tax=Corylus avellana TaxID=13451 RepID=UPI001E1EEC50|nr:two-component response regulator 24-like [Corylus avellana]